MDHLSSTPVFTFTNSNGVSETIPDYSNYSPLTSFIDSPLIHSDIYSPSTPNLREFISCILSPDNQLVEEATNNNQLVEEATDNNQLVEKATNYQPKKKRKRNPQRHICLNCKHDFKHKHRLDTHMEKNNCKRYKVTEVEDLTSKPHEMIGAAFNKCLEELRKLRLQNASDRRARYCLFITIRVLLIICLQCNF